MGDEFSLTPVPGTGQVVRETNTALVVRDAAIVAGVGGWVASMASSGAGANVGLAMLEMSKGLPFIAPVSPPSRQGSSSVSSHHIDSHRWKQCFGQTA
jgi:hypothetical protein